MMSIRYKPAILFSPTLFIITPPDMSPHILLRERDDDKAPCQSAAMTFLRDTTIITTYAYYAAVTCH
jgi:hypothetical protein